MAFCGYCGNQVPDDLKFCTECGKPLIQKKTIANDMQSDANNGQAGAEKMAAGPGNPVPPYMQMPVDERDIYEKYGWIMVVGVLVLCFFAFHATYAFAAVFISVIILGCSLFLCRKRVKLKVLLWLAMIFAGLFLAYSVRVGVSIAWFRNPTRQELINAGIIGGNSSSGSNVSSSRVDPDLKKFLDSYEDFVDDYIAFMKKYQSNPQNALSMMNDYMDMLAKYNDFASKAAQYNTNTMSQADATYYLEVMARIEKKLLDVS